MYITPHRSSCESRRWDAELLAHFESASHGRLARGCCREGVVAVESNRIARITAPRREDAVVEWNAEGLAALGIQMEGAKQAFAESGPSRASSAVKWCI